MLITDDSGGIASEVEAPFTLLLAEPTLYAFSPELVEDAERRTYQADTSGVVYSIVLSGNAVTFYSKNPDTLAAVAGQLAAMWDENRAVPGVTDIVPTQDVSPLGSLYDVTQVAVESTSGRSTRVLTLQDQQVRPDVFAAIIADAVKALDAAEKAT